MAINDNDYCEAHGLIPSDRNLAYVDRVRRAGAFLRSRLRKELELARDAAGGGIRGPKAPENIVFVRGYRETEEFEDRAMAARRLGRDRKSRHALREQLQLRVRAPKRQPVAQHDVDGLALFDQVRSPAML